MAGLHGTLDSRDRRIRGGSSPPSLLVPAHAVERAPLVAPEFRPASISSESRRAGSPIRPAETRPPRKRDYLGRDRAGLRTLPARETTAETCAADSRNKVPHLPERAD